MPHPLTNPDLHWDSPELDAGLDTMAVANICPTLSPHLAEHGIKCKITNTYTPQENGVSEHANWTISTLTCSMIADTKEVLQAKSLPLSLWPQAIQHAVWIKNHIPSRSLNRCRRDKNSVSSPPLEPCFDIPNNSPNHLLNSLLLCLEKLAKKSSNQTTHLFSCQNSL